MDKVKRRQDRPISLLASIIALLAILLSPNPAFCHPIDMDALAQIESSNNPKAYNKKSQARGLYQITPIVLKHYNYVNMTEKDYYVEYDLNLPEINTKIANWYLNWLFKYIQRNYHKGIYNPDYERAWEDILIAYNWGPNNWRKWSNSEGKIKLPKETQAYLRRYQEITSESLYERRKWTDALLNP